MNKIVNPAMIKEAVAARKKEILVEFIEAKVKENNPVKISEFHNQREQTQSVIDLSKEL